MRKGLRSSKSDSSWSSSREGRKSFEREDSRLDRDRRASSDTSSRRDRSASVSKSRDSHVGRSGSSRSIRKEEE